MIQGMGGLMSITGERDDLPGGGPQKAGIPIADIITGMYATIAVCAALAHREKSGPGQHLDLALLDSLAAILSNQGGNYLATGVSPGRLGNAHPNIVPYQTFKTSDGDMILACGNDNLFRKFCEVARCEQLAADPRYATNGKRVENRVELTKILSEIFGEAHYPRLGRGARSGGRAERPDQHAGAGVPGAAGDRARAEDRARSPARGPDIAGEKPDALLGDAARAQDPAARRWASTRTRVLRGMLKLGDAEIAKLRADGVI